jgi:hypothetical protein
MANVLKVLARTTWLDELAAEARAHVPVAEEEHEAPDVAVGAAVDGAPVVPLVPIAS